jgi:hypothetical protein
MVGKNVEGSAVNNSDSSDDVCWLFKIPAFKYFIQNNDVVNCKHIIELYNGCLKSNSTISRLPDKSWNILKISH